MQLPPLTSGHILRRYKRFLADVELKSGEVITAHCPNTGTMASCWEAGAPVQLSHSDNPKRKLAYTLERVDMGGGWIGVNTHRVNNVVAEGIAQGRVAALTGYRELKQEFTIELAGHPRSRIDIRLSGGEQADALVEVKNATLLDGDRIRFPDAVSARGLKHLELLAGVVQQGLRGVMLYAINRPEGDAFSPADSIDPVYGKRLREVAAAGVEIVAVRIEHREGDMQLGTPVRVEFEQ